MKRIVLLGSTGSIGRQTLDVIRNLPGEFKVTGLAAGENWSLLAKQVREFQPLCVTLSEPEKLDLLKKELGGENPRSGVGEGRFGNPGLYERG